MVRSEINLEQNNFSWIQNKPPILIHAQHIYEKHTQHGLIYAYTSFVKGFQIRLQEHLKQ